MGRHKTAIISIVVIVIVGWIILYSSFSSKSASNTDVIKAEVDIAALEKLHTELDEKAKISGLKVVKKSDYNKLEEDGTYDKEVSASNSGTYRPTITINRDTFVQTETGSLSSAYGTGYIGTITIPDAGVSGASLYRSSDASIIDNNIYATEVLDWSGIIGVSGSTPVICGHNNIGVFGGFGRLSVGSEIYFDLGYGEFIYEVTGFSVGDLGDDGNIYFDGTNIMDYGMGGGSNMILYTCYPLTAHPAYQRYIVYATLVEGTELS